MSMNEYITLVNTISVDITSVIEGTAQIHTSKLWHI